MALDLFFMFLCAFIFVRLVKKGKYKDEPAKLDSTENVSVDTFELEALKKARVTNRPLIQDWIEQMNASKNRPIITYWDFVPGSAENIRFTLLNENTIREGHLQFKNDQSKPRVSQMIYEDADGKMKSFKGYIIKDYTLKQLKNNLKVDMSDTDKLSYINKVAMTAFQQGQATFDIKKYDGLSKTEFEELWDKKKVSALCQTLVEEKFFASAKSLGANIISVTPYTDPD